MILENIFQRKISPDIITLPLRYKWTGNLLFYREREKIYACRLGIYENEISKFQLSIHCHYLKLAENALPEMIFDSKLAMIAGFFFINIKKQQQKRSAFIHRCLIANTWIYFFLFVIKVSFPCRKARYIRVCTNIVNYKCKDWKTSFLSFWSFCFVKSLKMTKNWRPSNRIFY